MSSIFKKIENNGKVIVITSLTMLFFVIALSSIFFFVSIRGAEQVLVPNVVGKKLEDALLEMQVKELYPRLQRRFSESPEDEGKILDQNPPAGSVVKAGRYINITVSRGAVVDKVENYVGKNIMEVSQYFASLFSTGHKHLLTIKEPCMYTFSPVPEGTILEQNPQPGQEIGASMEMEFVISKGPENEKIIVPDFSGMKLNSIYEAMKKTKLDFYFDIDDGSQTGDVEITAQNIPPETDVQTYSKIILNIKTPADGKNIFGIYVTDLPKYPYPVKISADAVYNDGKRAKLTEFKSLGSHCAIPYYLPEGTIIILTVLNKEVKTFEVTKGA